MMQESAVAATQVHTEVIYRVLVNGRAQYALWPDQEPLPWGWQPTGKSGTKADCVKYVAAQTSAHHGGIRMASAGG